jgi:hypothetical protein
MTMSKRQELGNTVEAAHPAPTPGEETLATHSALPRRMSSSADRIALSHASQRALIKGIIKRKRPPIEAASDVCPSTAKEINCERN